MASVCSNHLITECSNFVFVKVDGSFEWNIDYYEYKANLIELAQGIHTQPSFKHYIDIVYS